MTDPETNEKTNEKDGIDRQRETLYRVLADNVVRQLRQTGYRQGELVGFASEVARAINDHWDAPDEERTRHTPPKTLSTATDSTGRLVIAGERVVLRRPTENERPALERWRNERLVSRSLIAAVLDEVLEHLADLDTRDDRLDMIVWTGPSFRGGSVSEVPVGLVTLHHVDREVGQAELGKLIGETAYRGKGAAQEATHLLVAYGFEHLGLNRIYLRTMDGNLKNIKINEQLGFNFEGVLRQAARVNGSLGDVIQMAMLRAEYLASRGCRNDPPS